MHLFQHPNTFVSPGESCLFDLAWEFDPSPSFLCHPSTWLPPLCLAPPFPTPSRPLPDHFPTSWPSLQTNTVAWHHHIRPLINNFHYSCLSSARIVLFPSSSSWGAAGLLHVPTYQPTLYLSDLCPPYTLAVFYPDLGPATVAASELKSITKDWTHSARKL